MEAPVFLQYSASVQSLRVPGSLRVPDSLTVNDIVNINKKKLGKIQVQEHCPGALLRGPERAWRLLYLGQHFGRGSLENHQSQFTM